MSKESIGETESGNRPTRGWAGWLLGRLHAVRRQPPRLAVLERIPLGPKQSLALIEAEGRRFLVATSSEGAPAFYPLGDPDGMPPFTSARSLYSERPNARRPESFADATASAGFHPVGPGFAQTRAARSAKGPR